MKNTNKKKIKIAVTGAAGQIGYALLFRIAAGQMFGPDQDVELRLLELESALPALNGVAMELDDCAFPLLDKVVCTSAAEEAFDGVDWCLMVGSVPRKQGMERSDLLAINGEVFTRQGKALNKVAGSGVKVFVVGNPCNTNCLIAMTNAPDIPRERFHAMTALDENRAKSMLARKAGVSVKDVRKMLVWGNHSAKQFPDYFTAEISGKPARSVIGDEDWLQNTFVPEIQQRGAAIIKARGSSSAASAANAVVDSVVRLTTDTPADDFFSTSVCSGGQYGVDPGLIFSFPLRVKDGAYAIVDNLEVGAAARKKIDLVYGELREERDAVIKLGLIK